MTQVSAGSARTALWAPIRSLRSRAFRLKLAAVLTAFSVAGLYASSQAMAQAPQSVSGAVPSGCDGNQVRWGYEVGLVPGADRGFSIEGIRVDDVPSACVGRPVAITYSRGGTVVRQAVRPLDRGVIDRLDRSVVGDVVVTAASWAPVS